MKRLFFLFFLCCVNFLHCFDYTLSICAIFRNDAPYLKEWIDYHIIFGVEHFWLYNNNSDDDFDTVLAPYIQQGIVELIDWPSYESEDTFMGFAFGTQIKCYEDGLNRSKNVSKWLACIDTDEFIFPVIEDSVLQCLETRYPHVSGLCISWVNFGTSNVQEFPEGGRLIDYLTKRAPLSHPRNLIYKTIVQPLHTTGCPNPHFCTYSDQHWHVNANLEKIGVINTSCLTDIIRLNHYWSRDKEFFETEKRRRHEKWGVDFDSLKIYEKELNEEEDLDLKIKYNKILNEKTSHTTPLGGVPNCFADTGI